ncbi:transcriptional regulator [Alkalihalobacillus sp. MEB130]|uniref:MarR family winged helix-turn-helix transcriptional regulator n=1 Tax=Alkalihalobacillus sp. MEB130 TaxID=2976704 RepID=UPI0028DE228D|nr:hypothetical protein [Alkalihalobacillus sp. MEB130]MDT8860122.1 transcriptional regulator [Alkalihalobacillus sp. MEB130]
MNSPEEQFADGYLFYALTRGLNFQIEEDLRQAVKSYELTFPSFRLLWFLYFEDNLTMTNLTYLSQTNMSNVYRQLEKLREEGLVTIHTSRKQDTRAKKVGITKSGRTYIKNFLNEHIEKSNIKIIQALAQIPHEDFMKYIEVSSLLCNDLLGESFSNFIQNSYEEVSKQSSSTS